MGDFLYNSGRRTNVHTKLYKEYKGSGYHNQNMPPVHQYTMPATILQPHNMSYNLQKPKTLKLHKQNTLSNLQNTPKHSKPGQKRTIIEREHSTRRGRVQRAAIRNRKALISLICTNRLISR